MDRRHDAPQITQQSIQNPHTYDGTSQLVHEASGFIAGPQIPTKAMSNLASTHLSPHTQGGLRPGLRDLSRTGSESDSLIDLYGRPRSHVGSMEPGDQTEAREGLYFDDEDSEHSRWIHRDKLALIESHEMQEAGIKLPRPGRSSSKSNGVKVQHQEHSQELPRPQYSNGSHDHDADLEEEKFQRLLRQDDENAKGPDDSQNFDTPVVDVVSPEPYHANSSSPYHRQQGLRSTSRIPIPKSSPLPIPQEHIERHAPLPRKRGTSGNWSGGDDEGITYKKTRARSNSVGSQVLPDDEEAASDSQNRVVNKLDQYSPSGSPSKRQIVRTGQGAASASARKASNVLRNVSDPQKSRTPSNTIYYSLPRQRPKSRSGLELRPPTAINRPEGEAPWLATMFKPDPRLPPDQQLLPTHAKRLQQEREAGFGAASKSGSVLNGGSGPLVVHIHDGLQSPRSAASPDVNSEKDEKGNPSLEPGWPLTGSPTKENGSPSTGADHGGYTTIPKFPNASTPPLEPAPGPHPAPTQQTDDEAKADKKKAKGGGCCAIM